MSVDTNKIQPQPSGLLGFLQLKGGATAPKRFFDTHLTPCIDLLQWYLEANCEYTSAAAIATWTNGFNVITNPITEALYVTQVGAVIGPLGAGESFERAVIAVIGQAAAAPVFLGDTASPGGVTAGMSYPIPAIYRPVLINPGESLGIFIGGGVAVPFAAASVSVRFARCPL